mmetsp:Transcript_29283/g.58673  ORF Transcript_29283/g.58673 Transcript_29283/m.58673 type:complete len:223 (+) Transcript_29283:131-799(+)
MKLHILPPSPNSHGCIAVVKHLKLEDKIEIVNAYGKTRTDEFLAINPCHCCPTLEMDGDDGAIWESNAVMHFLCKKFDTEGELYPTDIVKAGRVDMALDWRQTAFYPCIPNIGYVVFGMPCDETKAKEDFKKLIDVHFKTLLDVFLKDTPYCFSEKPTIADLAIAPVITFIKARAKFWDAVPDAIKEYHSRVLEAFPGVEENFKMLDGMTTSYSGDGADAEP